MDRLKGAESVFIPSIALGELYYGALRSGRPEFNVARIATFAGSSSVVNCDSETARRYGELKDEQRRKGRPLPENDLWIAALALQHDLTLITRDAHFEEVDLLDSEAW